MECYFCVPFLQSIFAEPLAEHQRLSLLQELLSFAALCLFLQSKYLRTPSFHQTDFESTVYWPAGFCALRFVKFRIGIVCEEPSSTECFESDSVVFCASFGSQRHHSEQKRNNFVSILYSNSANED
ncbi:hypothetical protein CEXT_392751 [Caerostris extrusa]|uniref:Uncharacterized protein n=1 Tax=Caerostris extrusa TaxID=172846 RepID=A0AAV4MTK5_CAEEX|nr:hypothetical protein CEXT_392751 [Caerostris extrusa]